MKIILFLIFAMSVGCGCLSSEGLATCRKLIKNKRYGDAVKECNRILKIQAENIEVIKLKGDALLAQNKFNEAADCYGKVVEASKVDADFCIKLGDIWLMLKNSSEASKYYKKALDIDSAHELASYRYAVSLIDLRRYFEAVMYLNKVQKTFENDPAFYIARGTSYSHIGMHELAMSDIDKSEELGNKTWFLYFSRGLVYQLQNKLKLALSEYKNAESLSPDNDLLCNHIGYLYKKMGNNDAAIEMYKKSIQLNPQNWESLYNLACRYSCKNDKNVALKYLEKSFKAGLWDWKLLDEDKDLDNIRDEKEFKALIEKYKR